MALTPSTMLALGTPLPGFALPRVQGGQLDSRQLVAKPVLLMIICAQRHGWGFPYLLDKQQSLARDLRAACTPEFYLFAPQAEGVQTLRYRGQLDGSRPGNDTRLDGRELRAALDAVLTGAPVNPDQTASVGCNVKWNPGHEPEWFG